MSNQKVAQEHENITFQLAMRYLRDEVEVPREVWSYETWSGIEPCGVDNKLCVVISGYIELVKIGAPSRDEDSPQWTWEELYAYKQKWVTRYYFSFTYNGEKEVA